MNDEMLEEIRDELRKDMIESAVLMRKTIGLDTKEISGLVCDLLDEQAVSMYKITRGESDVAG